MSGYILLSRSLLDNDIWRLSSNDLRLFLYILLNANYSKVKVYKYGNVTVGHGQVLKSYSHIANECSYTDGRKLVRWQPSHISRMLSRLQRDGRIRIISKGQCGSLIEVVNYASYQDGRSYRKTEVEDLGKHSKKVNKKTENIELAARNEITDELWGIWIDELGGRKPHPRLTEKRRRYLYLLFKEQLDNGNPAVLFRKILKAVKQSSHHMQERNYQLPESLFRNEERRESWAYKGTSKTSESNHAVSRQWSVEL
jgi:hypothetical protein